MQPLNQTQSAFIPVVASEDVDSVSVELATTVLGPFFMHLKLYRPLSIVMRRVEPLIFLDIIILASGKLHFVVSIIPTECIDDAFVVDSCEECLLLGHLSLDLDGFVVVVKTSIGITVAPKQENSDVIINQYVSEVGRELVLILTDEFPFEGIAAYLILWTRIRDIRVLLLLLRWDLLSNVNNHSTDSVASELKPESLVSLVHEEIILFCIVPEEFRLRQ